ncbi:hypothetical protein [Streptomyces sp. NPDC093225]|uniref:hypothetical protein n=1 Tax=Streptomyces sp. NPDC093225 TaxID=3366034 RepID=UPI00381BCCF8
MSTSTTDRVSAGAQVAAALFAAATLAANIYGDIPAWLGTAAALVLGGASVFFTWVWADPTRHPTRARLLLAGTVGALFAAAAVLVWPGVWPTESGNASRNPASSVDDPKASARQIKVTKIGGGAVSPGVTVEVDSCITVSGTGKIPSGYGLWVTNTYDADGAPALNGLSNLQRAPQVEGETDWQTATFGVGADKRDDGKRFWIYVFLLPPSADSALTKLNAGPAPGLTGPVEGATEVGRYAVERNANLTCKWQTKA